MDSFDYDDISELESDLYYKNHRTPQQIMLDNYNITYNRDWKSFLKSIEWDGEWLRHDTEDEKFERRKNQLWNSHPFKNFIDKDSILL